MLVGVCCLDVISINIMESKHLSNIDPAFEECFETREIPDHSIIKGPLLKKEWVINKLRLLKIDGSPYDLIDFYESLPLEFQIHEPEHYIDNIAYLRERFLFAYLLAKREKDSIVYFTGRNTVFHDYSGLNDLRNEIVCGIESLSLDQIIKKGVCSDEVYFEIPFLTACFNFFLHVLYAEYTPEIKNVYIYDDSAIKSTKEMLFKNFFRGIDDKNLMPFKEFLDDFLNKNKNKSNFNLGFKKYTSFKETFRFAPKIYKDRTPYFWEVLDEDHLSWEKNLRMYFDIHSVYDASKESIRQDVVVINSVIGACKLIERYADLVSESDLDYLRFKKPYLGEITKIILKEKVIQKDSDWRFKQQ